MLHKKTPYNKKKAKAYYLYVYASEYRHNTVGIFKQLSTYVNRVQYTVVKAILL